MSFKIKKTKNTPLYAVRQNPVEKTDDTGDSESGPEKKPPVKIFKTESSFTRSHSIRTSKTKKTEDDL